MVTLGRKPGCELCRMREDVGTVGTGDPTDVLRLDPSNRDWRFVVAPGLAGSISIFRLGMGGRFHRTVDVRKGQILGTDRLGTSSVWGLVAFGQVPDVGDLIGPPPAPELSYPGRLLRGTCGARRARPTPSVPVPHPLPPPSFERRVVGLCMEFSTRASLSRNECSVLLSSCQL